MQKSNTYLVFSPYLISLFFSLFLLTSNINEINGQDSVRSIIVSLIIGAVLYLITKQIFEKFNKSILFANILIIMFFLYGHFYLFFFNQENNLKELSRIRYLVPIFLLIILVTYWAIRINNQNLTTIVQGFFVIFLFLDLFQITSLLTHYFSPPKAEFSRSMNEIFRKANIPQTAELPDIYFIVLDGYSREDILRNHFDYDNSQFLYSLSELGFSVDECAQSNYSWTLPSLTSTLNMMYLSNSSDQNTITLTDKEMFAFLRNNLVREFLAEMGYSIIAYENGFDWLHWYQADYYLSPKIYKGGLFWLSSNMNSFEVLFLQTTAARLVLDSNIQFDFFTDATSNPDEIHRKRVMFTLKSLPLIHETIHSPKFIYAHIISPHSPFVFGPNGEERSHSEENINQAYVDQIQFINTKILDSVTQIINNNPRPKVIILLGDHGAPIDWSKNNVTNKLGILKAIYFSDGNQLSNNYHSSINIFPELLNHYFGTNIEYLPDQSILGNTSIPIILSCNN